MLKKLLVFTAIVSVACVALAGDQVYQKTETTIPVATGFKFRSSYPAQSPAQNPGVLPNPNPHPASEAGHQSKNWLQRLFGF
jgi:hypothetical protein